MSTELIMIMNGAPKRSIQTDELMLSYSGFAQEAYQDLLELLHCWFFKVDRELAVRTTAFANTNSKNNIVRIARCMRKSGYIHAFHTYA